MTARLFRNVEKRRICWKNARSQTAPTVELIVLMRSPASFATETSYTNKGKISWLLIICFAANGSM